MKMLLLAALLALPAAAAELPAHCEQGDERYVVCMQKLPSGELVAARVFLADEHAQPLTRREYQRIASKLGVGRLESADEPSLCMENWCEQIDYWTRAVVVRQAADDGSSVRADFLFLHDVSGEVGWMSGGSCSVDISGKSYFVPAPQFDVCVTGRQVRLLAAGPWTILQHEVQEAVVDPEGDPLPVMFSNEVLTARKP